MRSSASWWGSRARQFRAHLRASVAPGERAALATWITPAQLALFDRMHVADRRHGLDVVASLRAEGVDEPDVLVAGLLHDAGKGDTGVWPRVAYSLGERHGPWLWRGAAIVPGFDVSLERLRSHAETSAVLAAAAGCSARTVELIRHQDAPDDPEFGELLRARRRGQLMTLGESPSVPVMAVQAAVDAAPDRRSPSARADGPRAGRRSRWPSSTVRSGSCCRSSRRASSTS